MTKQEEWKKRLEHQRGSGLSVAAWCKKHGIRENQYHYWRRAVERPAVPAEGGHFAQVGASEAVELQIGEKIRLKIPADFDSATLTRLLEVLGC